MSTPPEETPATDPKTEDAPAAGPSLSRPLAMVIAAGLGILLGGVLWFLVPLVTDREAPTQVSTGLADIGGSFALIDQDGNTVTEADFAGDYLLVYFGYTSCPDVCPLTLLLAQDALELLGDEAAKIQPLFITIDPERDTVERMKSYVSAFSDQLVGLTGSPEAIKEAAAAYKIYYRKAAASEGEDPTNYLMDHVNILFLMGPDGKYITHFANPGSPEAVAEAITAALK